ncbi:Distantly related to plant expansins [Trametes cinnabarina]|uniref:Distantly related to plant expansins n=1 Tax=Pycnoporus cinnabarinus TaxID=5643 RepID=A0A060S900_PYCCI|nr:Distantly related to plant expansins [Trametes cinnabarina]
MFNSSRSFILALLSLAAFFLGTALAAPFGGPHFVASAHAHSAVRATANAPQNFTLSLSASSAHAVAQKRGYDNARFTYYDAGQNACGSTDDGNAYVMALSSSIYNNGEHCYKQVTLQYNGKQVKATVTDKCPGCKDAEADLSRPLFQALAPLDDGVIYGQWWFD